MRVKTSVLLAIAVLCLVGVAVPSVASACAMPRLGSAHSQQISVRSPNQSLFNEAVLHFVNRERCRAGRTEFRSDSRLVNMAASHSQGMAQTRVFAHRIPKAGYETMQRRLAAARVQWRAVAENIAKNYVYAINNRPISARTGGQCVFYYAGSGRQVPKHTYASLAEAVVAQWMGSPGHRRNILDRRFNRIGSGFAVDTRSGLCGEIYLTQNFAN
jgi:uncharacterized protein YkwD